MRGPGNTVLAALTVSAVCLACQFAWAQDSRPAPASQPASDGNQAVSAGALDGNQAGWTWPLWAASPDGNQAAKKAEAKQSGWLSLGTTLVGIEGSDQEFRQQKQINDNIDYGVRDVGYSYEKDGWLAAFTGRAMQPWDFGADVTLRKAGVGFVEGTFNEFPSYYNSTRDFYNFKPNIYRLNDKDLVTTRMDSNVAAGWYVDRYTTLQVRVDDWQKNGDFPTLAGGSVTNGPTTLYRNPDYTDVDQSRRTIGTDVIRKIGTFELKLSFDATDFDGSNERMATSYLSSGKVNQVADYNFTPNFNELRPKIELSGDLIEKVLRVEYEGTYGYTRSNSGLTRNTFDANVTSPTFGKITGTSLLNNWSDVRETQTSHDVRLVYTPSDRFKLYGGGGYQLVEQDGESLLHSFSQTTKTFTLLDHFDNSDTRNIWMGNAGAEYKVLDWLTASTDVRVEHDDLERQWSGNEFNLPSLTPTTSTKNNYRWNQDEPSDRYEYGVSLTAKPTRDLKFVLRWQETRINYDYDTTLMLNHGVPDPASPAPSETRATVGDYNRVNEEWSILTQYKPSSYFDVTYKLAAKTNTYLVAQDEPDPDTGVLEDLSNSLRVTVRPVDKLTVTVYGSIDDYGIRTGGLHDPRFNVPSYTDNYNTWGIQPSVELTSWLTLNGGFGQRWGTGGAMAETGTNTYPYSALDTYIGAIFKINKTWSADCRYTYSWFSETNNGDLNDFTGSTFTVGATARF